jgi:hypothetical protein
MRATTDDRKNFISMLPIVRRDGGKEGQAS